MATLDATAGLAALIGQLSPQARRTLARDMAKQLRERQQKRIAEQRNPDGSAYAPRAPRLRRKQGRIKRQMFAKLRQAKYLKARGTAEGAAVEFVGRVSRIANVHQFGLRDRVEKGGPEVAYPARELLGFTDDDLALIEEMVLDTLAI